VVDGGGLENHCGGNSTGGSNPSPSATLRSLCQRCELRLASHAKVDFHPFRLDGHAVKRCTALRMYFGWMQRRAAATSLYVDAQCGDFGW
jgi:hypothetical protein